LQRSQPVVADGKVTLRVKPSLEPPSWRTPSGRRCRHAISILQYRLRRAASGRSTLATVLRTTLSRTIHKVRADVASVLTIRRTHYLHRETDREPIAERRDVDIVAAHLTPATTVQRIVRQGYASASTTQIS
jgi:hypothetical protein